MNPLKATALLLFLSLNACDGPRLIVEEGLTLHGQKAREAISEMHIPVPENAKDIYFHSVGWQDPIVFISFWTDPKSAEKSGSGVRQSRLLRFRPMEEPN